MNWPQEAGPSLACQKIFGKLGLQFTANDPRQPQGLMDKNAPNFCPPNGLKKVLPT